MGLVRFLRSDRFPCGCTITRYCEPVASHEGNPLAAREHAYLQEKGSGCDLAARDHGRNGNPPPGRPAAASLAEGVAVDVEPQENAA